MHHLSLRASLSDSRSVRISPVDSRGKKGETIKLASRTLFQGQRSIIKKQNKRACLERRKPQSLFFFSSPSRTGPLTFLMIRRIWSSRNLTLTWVTWPLLPVRPMTFTTMASFTGVSCKNKRGKKRKKKKCKEGIRNGLNSKTNLPWLQQDKRKERTESVVKQKNKKLQGERKDWQRKTLSIWVPFHTWVSYVRPSSN